MLRTTISPAISYTACPICRRVIEIVVGAYPDQPFEATNNVLPYKLTNEEWAALVLAGRMSVSKCGACVWSSLFRGGDKTVSADSTGGLLWHVIDRSR
jgi:hypothetical protein